MYILEVYISKQDVTKITDMYLPQDEETGKAKLDKLEENINNMYTRLKKHMTNKFLLLHIWRRIIDTFTQKLNVFIDNVKKCHKIRIRLDAKSLEVTGFKLSEAQSSCQFLSNLFLLS